MFQGSFKDVLVKFQGCIKNVSCVFSRKLQIKFKECFKNILMKFCFCSFVVAWISSQLLEQKEGLLQVQRGRTHVANMTILVVILTKDQTGPNSV